MELYSINGNKLKTVELNSFKKERDIQDLVEKNTETLFGVDFVSSEFTIDEFRIDTLCFDNETKSFVIIEYKKGSSYSVIDQGYSYLSKMLNNKDSFVIEYCRKKNVSVNLEIDWSQSRIIFVSPSFNSYQKNSVNFQDIPFELWEIKRFDNNTIVLNQQLSKSNQRIKNMVSGKDTIIDKVNKEVKVLTRDDFFDGLNENMKEVINELEEKLSSFDDVHFNYKKKYLGVWKNKKVIFYVNRKKDYFHVDINRGIDFGGNVEKLNNIFTLDDSKKMFKEWNNKYKKLYQCKLKNTDNLDYFVLMIKQKYDTL